MRTASKASVTVEVNGQSRTFKDGEGITFPRNMGGKQTINGDQIQFVGYGLQIPSAKIDDYANVDAKGKVIVYLGQSPKVDPPISFRLIGARARFATEQGRRRGDRSGRWRRPRRPGRRALLQPARRRGDTAGCCATAPATSAPGAAARQPPARGAQPAGGGVAASRTTATSRPCSVTTRPVTPR